MVFLLLSHIVSIGEKMRDNKDDKKISGFLNLD